VSGNIRPQPKNSFIASRRSRRIDKSGENARLGFVNPKRAFFERLSICRALFFPGRTVNIQQKHRAADSYEQTPNIKSFEAPQSQERTYHAADKCARDSDKNSYNQPARVISRHNPFRKHSDNQTKKYP
jgi:hypothetical protein